MSDTVPKVGTVLSAMLALAAGCAEHAPLAVASTEPLYIARHAPGYSTDSCRVDSDLITEADFSARTPLGFSGADVVAAFNERASGMLIWEDDQSTTQLVLEALAMPAQVTSSGEVPRYQGYCVPMLEVRNVVISARTLDGRLDEQLGAEIIALSDGRGGIGSFFLTRASMAPHAMRGDFQMPAGLIREGEIATLSIDLSWSEDGAFRAHCAAGTPISDDPSEACSAYPGRLRFTSRPASLADNPNISPAAYLDVALARIEAR
jgi:hypothetical protein